MNTDEQPDNRDAQGRSGLVRRAWPVIVGVPVVAGIVLLLGWLVVPMLLLPAMYVMGLGPITVVLACAWSGLTWGAAATTWQRPSSIRMVLGGGAVGAVAFAFTDVLRGFLGDWTPVYGAIAAASLFSSVLEEPTVHRRAFVIAAILGGLVGAFVGTRVPDDDPRAALWIVTVALHGSIAVLTRSRWARLAAQT